MSDYPRFLSIPRLHRTCIVTEKLDGTNALVAISDEGEVRAGSRNRWVQVDNDNFVFAGWVRQNEEDLRKLGPGLHYGEWWGLGIQRGYGLYERRFSLFNTSRWSDPAVRPACCHVVPVLWRGMFDTTIVQQALITLGMTGSQAAPGFMDPEGICVYHEAARSLFKVTLGSDGHKGAE